MARTTSEIAPTMCDGSSCRKGKKYPVTLVAIVVVGTTGESPTVDVEEHCLLIKTAVEEMLRFIVFGSADPMGMVVDQAGDHGTAVEVDGRVADLTGDVGVVEQHVLERAARTHE